MNITNHIYHDNPWYPITSHDVLKASEQGDFVQSSYQKKVRGLEILQLNYSFVGVIYLKKCPHLAPNRSPFISLVGCILKSAISFHVCFWQFQGAKEFRKQGYLIGESIWKVPKDTRNPPTNPANLDLKSVESLWYQTWSPTGLHSAQLPDSHSFRAVSEPKSWQDWSMSAWTSLFSIPSSRFLSKNTEVSKSIELKFCTITLISVNFNSLHLLLHNQNIPIIVPKNPPKNFLSAWESLATWTVPWDLEPAAVDRSLAV